MRSPGLVVMVVVGLGIVGYAFYVLSAADEPHARIESGSEPSPEAEPSDASDRRRPRPRRAAGMPRPSPVGPPRAEPAPSGSEAPTPAAPARPEPEISLEQARERFAEYMAELDRLEAEGAPLTSPQWVGLYKRGHDALQPLQQNLDTQDPAQADELRRANLDMRAKLRVLEPRPVAVDPSAN